MLSKNQVPYFKYSSKDPSQKHLGSIEFEADVIHWIDDLDAFYQAFGYSNDMRKWGVLPDDYLWEEYLCDVKRERSACFQIHVIEYLLKYSPSFVNEYGFQCDAWIEALDKELHSNGKECRACVVKRSEKYCS
jgi:hypothetical protein